MDTSAPTGSTFPEDMNVQKNYEPGTIPEDMNGETHSSKSDTYFKKHGRHVWQRRNSPTLFEIVAQGISADHRGTCCISWSSFVLRGCRGHVAGIKWCEAKDN